MRNNKSLPHLSKYLINYCNKNNIKFSKEEPKLYPEYYYKFLVIKNSNSSFQPTTGFPKFVFINVFFKFEK